MDLKKGDRVETKSNLNVELVFEIEYFQTYGNDTLACGKYGCINVDLLQLVEQKTDESDTMRLHS